MVLHSETAYSKLKYPIGIASANLARPTILRKKMYTVIIDTNSKYGNVIVIETNAIGEYELPFDAILKAKSLRRKMNTSKKIRFLINEQVLSLNQLDSWAFNEYKSLSKCTNCPAILHDKEVFTHAFCKEKLFCSQHCADEDYKLYLEKSEDEHECDYK